MPLATHTRIPSRPWPTLCLLAGLLCTASLPAAQVDLEPPDALTAGDVIGEVVTALQEGDSDALLHRATRRVEIVLLGQSARYSRGQAALVLADFFRRHPARRVHLAERAVADEGRAALGRYWPDDGAGPFSLYVGFRTDGADAWQLDVIRIERAMFQHTGTR